MFVHIRLRMSLGGLATPFYGQLKIGGGKQGCDFEVRTWDWGVVLRVCFSW